MEPPLVREFERFTSTEVLPFFRSCQISRVPRQSRGFTYEKLLLFNRKKIEFIRYFVIYRPSDPGRILGRALFVVRFDPQAMSLLVSTTASLMIHIAADQLIPAARWSRPADHVFLHVRYHRGHAARTY